MTNTHRTDLQAAGTPASGPDPHPAHDGRLITAIDTGLVMTVEPVDPGHNYDVRLLVFADTTTLDELASRRVPAPTAVDALHDMTDAEQHAGGLNTDEARRFHAQIDHLTHPATRTPSDSVDTTPAAWRAVPPEARWRDVLAATAGAAVTHDDGYHALAAGLDRAVATGWDWATELPHLTHTPLPDWHAASELYYRLLHTHPAATPTPPDSPAAPSITATRTPRPPAPPAPTVDRGSLGH